MTSAQRNYLKTAIDKATRARIAAAAVESSRVRGPGSYAGMKDGKGYAHSFAIVKGYKKKSFRAPRKIAGLRTGTANAH